jgi:hypothetical protein
MTYAGAVVRTRHIEIARAVIAISEHSGIDEDLAELYASIVRQTIVTARSTEPGQSRSHVVVVSMGPRIVRSLSSYDFDEERRLQIAVRAAEAAVEVDDQRLASTLMLARTWRAGKHPKRGAEILAAAVRDHQVPDYTQVIRSAVCAGQIGDPMASAVLSAYSLSDHLNPAPITQQAVIIGIAALGAALLNCMMSDHAPEFAEGLAACGFLGMRTNPDPRAARYFMQYLSEGERHGVEEPKTVEKAMALLTTALPRAAQDLGDVQVTSLFGYSSQGFAALEVFLA